MFGADLQTIASAALVRERGNIQSGAYICAEKEEHSCQKSETTRNDRAFTV